ncbi:MAG: ABC transporter ATP-binding protein [Synechococcus sp.]|jgi:energy-coupling factor transport system ATP-binding protein|nr:ABC transporter ATP-binding protein [Synechococcus sp.]RCL61077.1 MAG: ABC transporter ATP-binding protein [Synechococcus sp. MED-G68]|tara:strand:- start:9330 stop:9971 length:642 start_codon:yes stop_codon:yes gene_type:complete
MLELNDIQFRPATSERVVLNDINLKASPGEPVLISGNSGSGKTSLLEVISGLAGAQKGSIHWNQQALTRRQRRWLCGVVFQFPERHFLGLNVSQELKLGHKRLTSEERSNVLRRVGLGDVDLRQAPERLSGGQQRRLALAVQLLRRPDVLLLDEPTAGLDWSVRSEVLELLQDLATDRLLIVVTHEPDLFEEWSGNHWSLREGRLHALSPLPL